MMDTPISRAKIALPTHRAEWLTRPRLLDLVYELLEFKLILVTAPAGYGKTTFMADVAHRVDIPVCWFALEELDQELTRFIAHFIAAIEARFPSFGEESWRELRREGQINLDRLTTILANETYVHIRDHFLIILDDYYLVEINPEVRQFVSLFVQRTDENCHVALLTRKLPDLPDLTLLVGRTQVGGLSFRELAFTPEEIREFIQQNYHEDINEAAATDLFEQTEGWITGLLLSAQTHLTGKSKQGRVARATGVNLSAYLMEQVLNQQPDYLCRFLLQTSLLETYNRQFCEQVLGDPPAGHSWQKLIFTVLEKNLFVQPLENGWVRYHHLFRDFLQAQLAQNDPDEYRRILYKLAEIYTQQGEWEKSRTIYQRLGDQEAVMHLIEQVSTSFAAGSRYQTLANWIDELPYALRYSNPSMLSLRGITSVMLGNSRDGIELLNQAAFLFRNTGQGKGMSQTLMRRGWANYMAGDFLAGLADAEEALRFSEAPELTQAESLRVMGLCQQRLGDFQSAVENLEKARIKFMFLGDQRLEATILIDLGILYRTSGKYDLAENAYHTALKFWVASQDHVRAATIANNLGVLYHFRGDYQRAAMHLEEALSYPNRTGNTKGVAYASLGDLYSDLNLHEATRSAYQTARHLASRAQDNFLLYYLDLAEARIANIQGGEAYAIPLLASAKKALPKNPPAYLKGLYELTSAQIFLSSDLIQAEKALELAINLFSEQPSHSSENMLANFFMALVKFNLNQLEIAQKFFESAIQLAQELGNPQPIIVALAQYQTTAKQISVSKLLEYSKKSLFEKASEFERQIVQLRSSLRKKEMSIPVGPPKMVIQGLGGNRVFTNGRELSGAEWQTVRARDIFFYILEHPKGVSRENIETTFWPEASPTQLGFLFKKTMYRLRRAFEKDPIVFFGDRYSFDFQGDYEYDVEEWEQALALVEHAKDESDKVRFLLTAIEFYKGVFLPEVDGEWASEKREYYQRIFFEANLFLGNHFFKQRDFNRTLIFCKTLLNNNPADEESHRLAMRTYAAQGNRGEVVRQYRQCAKMLKREYGLTPSKETVELFEALTQANVSIIP